MGKRVAYDSTLLELESIRKRKDKKPQSITYNVAKCKGGYGVYVRALSGYSLYFFSPLFADIAVNLDETSPEYGKITFNGEDFTGALPVHSNRIKRFATIEAARSYIDQLKAVPEEQQCEKLVRLRMWVIEKDTVLLKVQHFTFSREMLGEMRKVLSTIRKGRIEELAREYAADGVKTEINPTVARTKKVGKEQAAKMMDQCETKPYIVPGLVGMCKNVKQQGTEYGRRLSQKRKRTSSVSFWNKYR